MSTLALVHVGISAIIFLITWIEGSDEPAFLRTFTAAIIALFWLPMLILCIVFVALGHIGGWMKGWRK